MLYRFYPRNSFLCFALAFSLLLAGCGSKYGAQRTQVNYYPECYAPIHELRQEESDFGGTVAFGAILGALLGAAVGAAASQDASGAIIGGVAGAAIGGAGGHAVATNREQENETQRLARYSSELSDDMERVDSAILAARQANRCYDEQYTLALAHYEEGRISRESFGARIEEIRNGVSEAEFILGEISTEIAAKQQHYETALAEESTQLNRDIPRVEPKDTLKNESDPLAILAYQTDGLETQRQELDVQREEMRLRLEQYDRAQQAVTGA